ncbi:MAG: aminodeoxychorismate synthase component I [Verrucomicrobiae bacterium]|nr:aminodeoxychorismate synthase component I [Verrucomicrobiae bacterium]
MSVLVSELNGFPDVESLTACLAGQPGSLFLESTLTGPSGARYSLFAARPMLVLRSWGNRCLISSCSHTTEVFGNPWQVLNAWWERFELADEPDCPFPLGAAMGFWGYELKHFVEPCLTRISMDDLGLPECWVGFYPSLLVVDHATHRAWIVATGLRPDGTQDVAEARRQQEAWMALLDNSVGQKPCDKPISLPPSEALHSTLTRDQFLRAVERAQWFIRHGHIYQVNLSHRLQAPLSTSPFAFYQRLQAVSPAPFAAWLNAGDFQVASSSPEQFLRLTGRHITTRPIKGTRPRGTDATRDAQLAYELQTSPKEMAELVMITDLLRNDLGRVCEYGSVQVPDLARLERFAHVQHLVSTIEGELRPSVTHAAALAACFPGGSITGAPKIRAMQIIDELEPVVRGVYTGCMGYLGFNRESQLSITIRTAVCHAGRVYFAVGAGIVADSVPEAEYAETLDKAAGFLAVCRGSTAEKPAQVPLPPSGQV